MYRAAINESNVVICIGMDENQSGAYHDMGTWCDFTFNSIPELSQELKDLLAAHMQLPSCLKVVNNEVVLRSVAEVEADLQ